MRTAKGFAAALLLLSTAADAGEDAAATCERAKMRAAVRYGRCIHIEHRRELRRGTADYAGCSADLLNSFSRAESQANGSCPTTGDAPTIADRLNGIWNPDAALPQWFAGNRFVINGTGRSARAGGDGTVTDTLTGLMWELKTTEVGSGENLDDPHDVDNFYTVATVAPDGSLVPSGTAHTDFLPQLNNCVSTEVISTSADGLPVPQRSLPPTTTTGGFAGHCDWRLPTWDELATLCDATKVGAEVCWAAALDPFDTRSGAEPGPSVYAAYWTSLFEASPAKEGEDGIGPDNLMYTTRGRTPFGGQLGCQNASAAACRAHVRAVRSTT